MSRHISISSNQVDKATSSVQHSVFHVSIFMVRLPNQPINFLWQAWNLNQSLTEWKDFACPATSECMYLCATMHWCTFRPFLFRNDSSVTQPRTGDRSCTSLQPVSTMPLFDKSSLHNLVIKRKLVVLPENARDANNGDDSPITVNITSHHVGKGGVSIQG